MRSQDDRGERERSSGQLDSAPTSRADRERHGDEDARADDQQATGLLSGQAASGAAGSEDGSGGESGRAGRRRLPDPTAANATVRTDSTTRVLVRSAELQAAATHAVAVPAARQPPEVVVGHGGEHDAGQGEQEAAEPEQQVLHPLGGPLRRARNRPALSRPAGCGEPGLPPRVRGRPRNPSQPREPHTGCPGSRPQGGRQPLPLGQQLSPLAGELGQPQVDLPQARGGRAHQLQAAPGAGRRAGERRGTVRARRTVHEGSIGSPEPGRMAGLLSRASPYGRPRAR